MANAREAAAWLARNRNRSAFATNRFRTTRRAATYVRQVYAAGATEVRVANVNPSTIGARFRKGKLTLVDEGGPFADTLIVTFPEANRRSVAKALRAGSPTTMVCGDAGLFSRDRVCQLWWD